MKIRILFVLSIVLLSGCTFISNIFEYSGTTKEFAENLLLKDYDKCIGLMVVKDDSSKIEMTNRIKSQLQEFRQLLVSNFGDKLEYTFMSGEKKWSTKEGESTPPNTTRVLVQFKNDKEFGVFKILFDDNTKKILNIQALDVKAPIPNLTFFWLFGLIAVCIPVFNIYMIRRVKKSQYKKKWPKYLAIIILNIPAIGYHAMSGFSIEPLNFQVLLGISFEYMGYINSAWTFGLPIGGLYVLWNLYKGKDIPVMETQELSQPELPEN